MSQKRLFGLFATAAVLVATLCTGCNSKDDFDNRAARFTISASAEELVFDEHGGDLTLVINTNAAWQVNTISEWVSFTPGSGDEAAVEHTITVTIPANEFFTPRSTTISIKTGDLANDVVKRKFITIKQAAAPIPERAPGIYTKGDLIAFAKVFENERGDRDFSPWADEDGVINLMNDIDFGSDKIPTIGAQNSNNTFEAKGDAAFEGHFNGNEFTIKGVLDGGDKQIVALFTRLAPTGIIENLTVDVMGNSTYTGSNGHLSCLVGFSITGTTGYIKNCIAKGTLTQSGATGTRVGGIVGYGRCNITDCTNYATITAACNRVAGISGAGGNPNNIVKCTNNGDITVDCAGAQVGGIIGQQNGQTISGCKNTGNITATANGATFIGGITGQGQGTSAIGGSTPADGCSNSGKITLTLSATAANNASVAGIAGNITAVVPIDNCENSGKVTSTVDNGSVNAGGIVGQITAAGTISNCTNKSAGEVTSAQNAGGILGRATAAAKVVTCANAGNILALPGSTLPSSFIGGIIGNPGAATLTGCTYGGTVKGVPGDASNAVGM